MAKNGLNFFQRIEMERDFVLQLMKLMFEVFVESFSLLLFNNLT